MERAYESPTDNRKLVVSLASPWSSFTLLTNAGKKLVSIELRPLDAIDFIAGIKNTEETSKTYKNCKQEMVVDKTLGTLFFRKINGYLVEDSIYLGTELQQKMVNDILDFFLSHYDSFNTP